MSFSNRLEDARPIDPVASMQRLLDEAERLAALPAGSPEVLRAFRGPVVPVPPLEQARPLMRRHQAQLEGRECGCEMCAYWRPVLSPGELG